MGDGFLDLVRVIVFLTNEVVMSWMKSACDFFALHVLRSRRTKKNKERCADCLDSDEPSAVTLRTYTAGGDPFEDRIEFHLINRPGTPSGFRAPKEIKDGEVGDLN